METNTATLDQFFADVQAAAPRATIIRNTPQFGHVSRPNRKRARWIVEVLSDGRIHAAMFNGQGHVEWSGNDVTVDEIVAAL